MTRETASDFLRIDMTNNKTRKIITACQTETINRTIHFLLSNNGVPLDLSNLFYAEILIKRVNNTETDNPCIIDGEDIQYTLKANDRSVVGENEGHLILTFNDGTVLETPVFYINVFSTFYNPAALQSQNEYGTLTQQVLNAQGYAQDAQESAEDASTAAQAASNYESKAASDAAMASEYASTASSEASNASEQASTAQSAAATAASETAVELNSTFSSLTSEAGDYAASASEYASTASSEAAIATSNEASTSEYMASASAYASQAVIKASETANYATSTSEYMASASEYASIAGSEKGEAIAAAGVAEGYMNSASTYSSEAGSEASYANSCALEAEHWYQQAEAIAEGFAGTLIPMGTVAFVNLPSLANVQAGWMYNISDEFTTTSDFEEGSGHIIPAGSNVYKTANDKWDILAGSPVTGVKGDNEQYYRRGNVNVTKANIGLGNVRNEDIGDTDISSIGATVKAAILALFNKFSDYQTKLTNPLTQSDVKDSLTSTSTTTPLSANQGYIMSRDIPWYGTCSTAASTTAKVATTSDTKFALVTGAKVKIKFTYTNTATTPTLNVDSTGAKTIYAYGTTKPTVWWQAGDVVEFTYNGSAWIMGATCGQINELKSDLDGVLLNQASADGNTSLQNILSYLCGVLSYADLRIGKSKLVVESNGTKFCYNLVQMLDSNKTAYFEIGGAVCREITLQKNGGPQAGYIILSSGGSWVNDLNSIPANGTTYSIYW